MQRIPSVKPVFLQRLSTDEYNPAPYSSADEKVVAATADLLSETDQRSGSQVRNFAEGRDNTAAGLLALNDEWGHFYDVSSEAVNDPEAASDAFDGPEVVIDVQTHFLAPHCQRAIPENFLPDYYRPIMPAWWTDLEDPVAYDLGTWIDKVFLRTENAVAVLTSGPGLDDWRHLFDDEMASTRALIDGLAGTGRLLNHSVVHPNVDNELESMSKSKELYDPAGWKVYTIGRMNTSDDGFMFDDDVGFKFLERARQLDVKVVCVHKGLSLMVDNGSPRDIGPAAKAFPDLSIIVYHSGYEFPTDAEDKHQIEGPYTEATAHIGVNRLISSVLEAEVAEQRNVCAELGTTWFALVRRPVEAAHVLGKLIKYLGEDNVIWGTDSIWYGSAQPLIDAFRAFQIPDAMCEEFGYEPLTPQIKAKILGLNAARVYNIDIAAARSASANDDFAWAREYLRDYEKSGFSGLR
jgi:uncharacterized protein